MGRIFYFMHIPWGWAKQRPQFLAEELSRFYEVDVFYKQPYTLKNLSDEKSRLNLYKLLMIPGQTKYRFVREINIYLIKIYFKFIISKYKFIWITSPELVAYIPKLQKGQFIIYDCMDDMLSFPNVKSNRELYSFYEFNESKLIESASIIFSSSENLKMVLLRRYSNIVNITVINNAISNNLFDRSNMGKSLNSKFTEYKNIVYVGTLSKWMDWDLISESLNEFENICYHFYGPVESSYLNHDRVKIYGPVAHNMISQILINADILVMPFIVNDLILSVNPVKLYEYIFARKPVISVHYQESAYFEEFVYLYDGKQDYFDLIKLYLQNKLSTKGTDDRAFEFCLKNTWKYRTERIVDLIEKLNVN